MTLSKKKSIAIIGSGEMAVIIAVNAKKMGIISHSFSNDMNDRVVGVSDFHHNISIFDVDKLVDECIKLDVCGILPTTELTVSIAAKVAEKLKLNGMPVIVAENVTDKGFVREKAEAVKEIYQPKYVVWNVNDTIPEIDRYPVIVKPASMGGKRGVSVVSCANELKKALKYSIENMPAHKTRIIIEEYISGGKEYSVEGLSCHGVHKVIQITEKITSGPPNCVELGHIQPAYLEDTIRNNIITAIPKLLEAVGVDNSTSHTEIKIVKDKIYLIELNARSGGDHIAYPLTELSTGYPYIQETIHMAMNDYEVPDIEKFEKHCCGVIFVTKQTAQFKNLFDDCERYDWLYKKNKTTDKLQKIVNNQAFDTNYMIFKSEFGVPEEIETLLKFDNNTNN